MNAGETDDRHWIVATLREMEAGGYHFDLDEDGEATFRYEPPAPDAHGERLSPDQWPPLTRWAVESSAGERLARIRPHRDELRDILASRRSWGELWAEWGRQPDDPLRDAAYALRLCELAIAAGFPCYDGGQVDLSEAGWRRVTARMIAGFFEEPEATLSTV